MNKKTWNFGRGTGIEQQELRTRTYDTCARRFRSLELEPELEYRPAMNDRKCKQRERRVAPELRCYVTHSTLITSYQKIAPSPKEENQNPKNQTQTQKKLIETHRLDTTVTPLKREQIPLLVCARDG